MSEVSFKATRPEQRIGQYRFIAARADRKHRGHDVIVVCYGAYDAHGLVGPELNGIAVLDATEHCVVLDGHFRQSPGWYDGFGGPRPELLAEFQRIAAMDEPAFNAFVREHPMFRGRPVPQHSRQGLH